MIPPDLAPRLGMYGIADMLKQPEWAPLGARLLALYAKLADVPGVPASWLTQVQAQLQAGNLVRPFPPAPGGMLRSDIPPWLAASPGLQSTWAEVAKVAERAVNLYANAFRVEGLREVEAMQSRAAFWNAAYLAAVAIRDAPKNAAGAVLAGASNVGFGLASTLLKSPIVWAVAVAGVIVFLGPAKVARAALAKVGAK